LAIERVAAIAAVEEIKRQLSPPSVDLWADAGLSPATHWFTRAGVERIAVLVVRVLTSDLKALEPSPSDENFQPGLLVKALFGSPHAAARGADPHSATSLVAFAIHEQSGRPAAGHLIASGEAEHTRYERHR
jgi:hypothetical protein